MAGHLNIRLSVLSEELISYLTIRPYYTDEGKNTILQDTKEKKTSPFFDNHSVLKIPLNAV